MEKYFQAKIKKLIERKKRQIEIIKTNLKKLDELVTVFIKGSLR